jgi:DNA-binding SARP family transcriptional activator
MTLREPQIHPPRGHPALRICLFGSFEVWVNDQPLPRLRSRKVQSLLALLTLRAGTEVERSWLAGQLWPASPESTALATLRRDLTSLRRALGLAAGCLRSPTSRTLCFDLEEEEADVLAFATAIARDDRAALEQAVALYRGPLLEEWTEEWVFQERQVREQAYVRALETLAAGAMASGEAAAAEGYLRQVVGVDPLRETAQRRLMQALASSGNYAAAMLTYQELRRWLHREIHAEPDAETTVLFEQLRAEARGKTIARRGTSVSSHQSPVASDHKDGRTPGAATALTPADPRSMLLEQTGSLPGAPRLVLLHQRHAQPDEQLVKALETRLAAHGYQVYADHQAAVGLEWARQMERQVRTADVVIPLLSPASVQSEMLAYGLQMAQEAADREGKPRLLPVWVNDPGPLPEPLASIGGPLDGPAWASPQDEERLMSELLNALRSPDPAEPRQMDAPLASPHHPPASRVLITSSPYHSPAPLEPVSGAVPIGSPFYVVRRADGEFGQAIAQQDSIVLIKGARQMGKTSLLARGLRQAREAGARVVLTDFQKLNTRSLDSAENLLLTLAQWMAVQLDLSVMPQETWNPGCSPNLNFELFLRRQVLSTIDAPVVWGLDEVDRLFPCDCGSEVFGLFRSWHNERILDPASPWSRFTLVITYATEAHLFITDLNQSPFNVGTRLRLDDFTREQVADLNRRLCSPLRDEEQLARFFDLVGGQPYLVRRGLHEMTTQGLDVAALAEQADQDQGIFGDHLRRIMASLGQEPELCEAVRQVLRGGPCPTAASFYHLRGAGVLVGESARDARPRCELYAAFLRRHLLP